jgi:hypothetical protein
MLLLTLASFFVEFDGQYVGKVKDWTTESRCYAFWELPELKVQLQERLASAEVSE